MTHFPPPSARPAVQALRGVAHGALDFAELERLGFAPEQVADFSTNTNPYGPPPGVSAALHATPIAGYPDREALALRRALSARLDLPIECLLAGNGSAELLWLAALAFLNAGDPAMIAGPTFGEYAHAAALTGAAVDELRAAPEAGFRPDTAALGAQLARRDYRLAFICNPNNPTGQVLEVETLAAWAQAFPATLFVIDEAYLAFAGDAARSVIGLGLPNLLALCSMTKDYALTGLRLGYAAGHPQVIAALRRAQPPWSVNAMAQAAGVAALNDPEHVRATLARLLAAKAALAGELAQRGYTVLPSAVQFFLIHVGDAARFRSALLPFGVLVRDCASFGMPEYVRIAARTPDENARLLAAIDEARP